MSAETTALDFLRFVREGNRAGAERLLAPDARHHSPYFKAGAPALLDAIEQAAKSGPPRFSLSDVKHVMCDGDYVAVHSHVYQRQGDPSGAVFHLFRFKGDLIAEVWEVGQLIPADNPNTDGMF